MIGVDLAGGKCCFDIGRSPLLNNLLDEHYKESAWGTFTYGEPRNLNLAANYRF
jgi:outer membrane receptor for ferric coprogen and ferric-rhodotorulic acid